MNQSQSTFSDKFLVLLFELFFGLTFNLVGTISVSEIFLVLYTISTFTRSKLKKSSSFKSFTRLYIYLIGVQVVMEALAGNSPTNAAKGIAITVVSFLHLYFLLTKFQKDKLLVAWALIGMLIRPYIFGTDFSGDASDALSGEDATFLKFVLAPIIINAMLIYSIIIKNKSTDLLFIYVGLFFVVIGARSSGMMTFLTGLISWLISTKGTISKKRLLSYIPIILILGYGAYAFYVANVLNGNITAGNSNQLLKVSNPYNPLYLLMAGRAEFFVGIQAFLDNPFIGWGSWHTDSSLGYRYNQMLYLISQSGKEFNAATMGADLIPTHSVIISYGVYNGILALYLVSSIIFKAFSMGFKALPYTGNFLILSVSASIQLLWNSFFSPQSHFRYSLPLYMAILIIANWHTFTKNQKNGVKA